MRFLFARLYSLYAGILFGCLFLVILPFQFIFSLRLSWHRLALCLNTFWAWAFMVLSFLPFRVMGRRNLPKGQFLLCANHFSYLDIPALGLIGVPFKFFGKASLKKIPIFGWMYGRLHVTVDRSSFKSRACALNEARRLLDAGFHMNFFPEGGVRVSRHPQLAPFHDGAFRLAVEKKLPVVPVLMPFNHRIWPYDDRQLFYRSRCLVRICPPIWPAGEDERHIRELKERVRSFMQQELDDLFGLNSLFEIVTDKHES